MNSIPSNSEAFSHTLDLFSEPSTFNEEKYIETAKPIDSSEATGLKRFVNVQGDRLIEALVRQAAWLADKGDLRASPHLFWGKRVAIIGLSGMGGSYLVGKSLGKTTFVASWIIFSGSAAQYLYGGYILIKAHGESDDIAEKAASTKYVQGKMRKILNARLDQCKSDQLVDQGREKFDEHGQNIDDHGRQLALHEGKHTAQEQEIEAVKRINENQAHQLREQASELTNCKGKLADQENKLTAQASELTDCKSKLNSQAETIVDLTARFKALENLLLAQAGQGVQT